METDWLVTFVTAAELHNFHRAAMKLHLSQPTVTMHIQKLEHQLGMELFERTGRHVVLSPAGRKFLPYAEQTLTTLASGRDMVMKWQQGYSHTVTISSSPLVATTYLPRWIRGFQAVHRDVTFEVRVAESPDILGHLLDLTSDIGLSRMETSHHDVDVVSLYADPVVLTVPGGEPDINLNANLSELLSEFPLLTHNHPGYWDELLFQVQQRVPTLRTMRISQVHVTLRFIIERMGVSFLPLSTIRRGLTTGILVEVPCPDISLPTAMTYLLRHGRCSEAAVAFADYVKEYMTIRRP